MSEKDTGRTSSLANLETPSTTESNLVVTQGEHAAPIRTTEAKDCLGSIPEELIKKTMKLLHPVHSTCLSLTGEKFYRIHKDVYPENISLHAKYPKEVRLYNLLNSWMEARGFLFVAVKIVAKRHILWICADDVGCADYLRAEDTEDEAYVADYVAKLKRKGDYAKVSIYQFGGPEDNDDELWERLNRRVD